MDNELTCCVCLDLYTKPLMLPCSHNFCQKCLWDLFFHSQDDRRRPSPVGPRTQIACPKCRRQIPVDPQGGIDNLPFNLALDNIVKVYKAACERKARKCRTHLMPLSFYCQTCKRTLCDACVSQSHSGFGHCVKDISDFIQEEKDNAKASLHELEIFENSIIARNTEVTTLIINAKIREKEFKKTVGDQFEVMKQCINVQQSKVLEDVSLQLGQSRVSLEKLAENFSSMRSDIQLLRNSHQDALQQTNPQRQLTLLQGLTLRLSSFLTFKTPSLPLITHTEQDGHINNVESVIAAIRQLNWANTTIQRGDQNVQTRDRATQTEKQLTDLANSSHGTLTKQQPNQQEQEAQQQKCSPPLQPKQPQQPQPVTAPFNQHQRGGHQKKPLGQCLDIAARELRQLTGGVEQGQPGLKAQKGTSATLADTIKKLQQLQMDHKAQTLGEVCGTASGDAGAEVSSENVAFVDWSTPGTLRQFSLFSTSGACSSENGVNSADGASGSAPQYSRDKPVVLPTRFKWPGISEPSEGTGSSGMKNTVSSSLSQNGNGPQEMGHDEDDDSSCFQGCSSGFNFRKAAPEMVELPPVNAMSSKPETLKLYFGQSSSHSVLPDVDDVASTSSAAAGIPVSTNSSSYFDVANSVSEGSLRMSNCEQVSSMSNSVNCARSDFPACRGTEAGAASSPSPVLCSMELSDQVAPSQFCGVGARPKVLRSNKISSGAVGVDLKDERKVGASLKEGLNSAVCTIKSLCRASFSTTNKDTSLDVNANDNGAAAEIHRKDAVRSVSVPASSAHSKHDAALAAQAVCHSVGTSPVMFDNGCDAQENHGHPSVWSNFSFNDSLLPQSSEPAASGGVFGSSELPTIGSNSTGSSQSLAPSQAALQSDTPKPFAGATAKWTSFSQLPKWDSNQTLQSLSKIDLSEFWTLANSTKNREQSKKKKAKPQEVVTAVVTEVSNASALAFNREKISEESEPTSGASGVSLPRHMSFDYVPAACTNIKQRRHQKTRKRNQQPK